MARGRLIALSALIVGIVMTAGIPATAAALGGPVGFRLPASNGYSIHAIVFDGERLGEHDEVILFVGRKDGGVAYFVQKGVEVTETTVSADLGALGSIDLHFVPSGKPRKETSACDPHPIEFDSGNYEGRFDFVGEEGYTQAHVTHARGEIRVVASLICGPNVDEGFGGHSPGARLLVRRHWQGGGLEFQATKNSPSRTARFSASIKERHGGIVVVREISAEAGPGAFEFDVPDQAATLNPPAPFSGSARFLHSGRRPGRLAGDLSLDFPGRSNVSLGGTRGSLNRWVQNPSHPFRPAPRLLRSRS